MPENKLPPEPEELHIEGEDAPPLTLAQIWAGVRENLSEAALDKKELDQAERLTKVWERILKCERLARDLEAEEQGAVAVDVKIEGL